jgi:hypothetical protein
MANYKLQELLNNGFDFNTVFPEKQENLKKFGNYNFGLQEIALLIQKQTDNFKLNIDVAIDIDSAMFRTYQKWQEQNAPELPEPAPELPEPTPAPLTKEAMLAIIDGIELLLELETDEKKIKKYKLRIKILKEELSQMQEGGEILFEKSVTDENMFQKGGSLAYVREDLLSEGLEVPVGDEFLSDNKGYEYKYDDEDNLLILHNGEWKEAVGTDWEFKQTSLNSSDENENELPKEFLTSNAEDVLGFVSEQKALGDYQSNNIVYYILQDNITGSFIVCMGILYEGVIINGSEAVDDYFSDKSEAIKIAHKMAFPHPLVGTKAVINDNLEDHVGYDGSELTIVDVAPENFFFLKSDNGLTFMASEEEIKFIN